MMKRWWWSFAVVSWVWAGPWYYMNGHKAVELTLVQTAPSVRSGEEKLRFIDPKGQKVVVGKRLIVQFDSMKNLQKYLDRFELRIVKKYRFSSIYLLEASSPKAAMKAANALYDMPDVRIAQPNIERKFRLR